MKHSRSDIRCKAHRIPERIRLPSTGVSGGDKLGQHMGQALLIHP